MSQRRIKQTTKLLRMVATFPLTSITATTTKLLRMVAHPQHNNRVTSHAIKGDHTTTSMIMSLSTCQVHRANNVASTKKTVLTQTVPSIQPVPLFLNRHTAKQTSQQNELQFSKSTCAFHWPKRKSCAFMFKIKTYTK